MNVELLMDLPAPQARTPDTVRALLTISGEPPGPAERVPMNLALVLDRSGSMGGEPLRWATDAAGLLVRRVWPEDRVSAVFYDHEVLTIAEAAAGGERDRLLEELGSVPARGMTNLSGGWLRGRDLVHEHLVSAGVNRVILLTDGLANQGITDPHLLTELCRTAASHGITTTTIGFGPSFNEDLLTAMADAGGGAAYYVERPDQAPGIFEEEVEGLLSLAAQNVAVEISTSSGCELTQIHHSYPRTDRKDGVRLELGDLYAREPRRVLCEFRLTGPVQAAEIEVGRIRISGHVLKEGGRIEAVTVELPIRHSPTDGPRVEPEVERVALLLAAARAREEALTRWEAGDALGASYLLSQTAERLTFEAGDDDAIVREATDLAAGAAQVAAEGLSAMDIKYMKQQTWNERRSRAGAKERIRRGGGGEELER
jgi:Ca-activated chloride channel homolog